MRSSVSKLFQISIRTRQLGRCLLQPLLGLFSLGEVSQSAANEQHLVYSQRAEADLHTEFAAVFAASRKFHSNAHWTGARLRKVLNPLRKMTFAETLRQENFQRLV